MFLLFNTTAGVSPARAVPAVVGLNPSILLPSPASPHATPRHATPRHATPRHASMSTMVDAAARASEALFHACEDVKATVTEPIEQHSETLRTESIRIGQRCLDFRKQFLGAAPTRLTVAPTDAYKSLNALRADLAKQEVRSHVRAGAVFPRQGEGGSGWGWGGGGIRPLASVLAK
jgi:hypothetical protein